MKKAPFLLLLLMLLFACEREPVKPNEPVGKETVKDHEGNEYAIKTYGSQTWMVENMKAKTTKDGKNILKCPANGQFSYEEPMAYYAYDKEEYTTNRRGYLYNFAAANEICPDGWHLPSVDDWQTLMDYVERKYTGVYNGDEVTVAKALASEYNWRTCDTVAGAPGYHCATNNTSGFGLKAVGDYIVTSEDDNPDFHNYFRISQHWTSSSTDAVESYGTFEMLYNETSPRISQRKIFQAFSVRCVKNN